MLENGSGDGPNDPSDEWFRALVDRSTDIVAVIDADGEMRYKSPATTENLGYDPDALSGENALSYVHPEDRDRVQAAIAPVMEGDRTRSDPYEYRFRTADGSYQWFESVVTDGTDSVLDGYVVNSRDVTERKRREQELERERNRLDRFASLVSHDLRNPLAVAEGQLELAVERDDPDRLERVAAAHERMRDLVDDMLVLAREGRRDLSVEPVALPAVAERSWDGVDGAPDALSVPADGRIRADEGRLRRLFENLFRNAVEHGRGRVSVTVESTAEGFAVVDDGGGLDGVDADRLFEHGFTTADSGTGLGLAIVEEIAAAHGWTVAADEHDDGMRFAVRGVERPAD